MAALTHMRLEDHRVPELPQLARTLNERLRTLVVACAVEMDVSVSQDA